MSVKFEKEQVRVTEGIVGRDGSTAHKIGEALTGGKQQTGYLAVYLIKIPSMKHPRLTSTAGLPTAAPIQPSPNQDAYLRLPRCPPRSPSILPRP